MQGAQRTEMETLNVTPQTCCCHLVYHRGNTETTEEQEKIIIIYYYLLLPNKRSSQIMYLDFHNNSLMCLSCFLQKSKSLII